MVLVPQAPSPSLSRPCPGSPSGCSSRLRPGRPPELCAIPRFPDPALPCGAPSLPPAPRTRAARSPRGPGVCGALLPASRRPHSSPEAAAPSAPLLPQGAPAGPRRGSWRPSPECEAPGEGEGAERAERLSHAGRAPGEGHAGRCGRRGRTGRAALLQTRPRGAPSFPPSPPQHAPSAQAPGLQPGVGGPVGGGARKRALLRGGLGVAPGSADTGTRRRRGLLQTAVSGGEAGLVLWLRTLGAPGRGGGTSEAEGLQALSTVELVSRTTAFRASELGRFGLSRRAAGRVPELRGTGVFRLFGGVSVGG